MDDVVELEGVVRLREALQVQRIVLQHRRKRKGEVLKSIISAAPRTRSHQARSARSDARVEWGGEGPDLVADDGDADDHDSAGKRTRASRRRGTEDAAASLAGCR